MTSNFFWPSLMLVMSLCILAFSVGFTAGRIYQLNKQEEEKDSNILRETITEMVNNAVSKALKNVNN